MKPDVLRRRRPLLSAEMLAGTRRMRLPKVPTQGNKYRPTYRFISFVFFFLRLVPLVVVLTFQLGVSKSASPPPIGFSRRISPYRHLSLRCLKSCLLRILGRGNDFVNGFGKTAQTT